MCDSRSCKNILYKKETELLLCFSDGEEIRDEEMKGPIEEYNEDYESDATSVLSEVYSSSNPLITELNKEEEKNRDKPFRIGEKKESKFSSLFEFLEVRKIRKIKTYCDIKRILRLSNHNNAARSKMGIDKLKVISSQKIISFLTNDAPCFFEKVLFIDCRFGFEVNGGRIKGAFRARTKKRLENLYKYLKTLNDPDLLIIFYCELSINRAPLSAQYFRQIDRLSSASGNPSFRNLFILKGGYREFWQVLNKRIEKSNSKEKEGVLKELCTPFNFISMSNKNFKLISLKKTRHMKKHWRKSLTTILRKNETNSK